MPGGCYLRLDMFVPASNRNFLFFVAPDRRYLTAGLYDMVAAPGGPAAGGVERLLLADPGPSRGPANARVVIVEFSDFECPFCRLLKQYEDAVLPPARDVAWSSGFAP